ncbi:MAG: phosphodiester glycosidase family protein [Bradymonadia bacterium]
MKSLLLITAILASGCAEVAHDSGAEVPEAGVSRDASFGSDAGVTADAADASSAFELFDADPSRDARGLDASSVEPDMAVTETDAMVSVHDASDLPHDASGMARDAATGPADIAVPDAEPSPPDAAPPPPDAQPPEPDAAVPFERVSPSCDPAHTTILRFYRGFFGREADIAGGNGWINAYQTGTSLDAIAAAFGGSVEFGLIYDGLDDEAFIRRVYQNALDRDAEPAGLAFWLDELGSGRMSRVDVVVAFANSAESALRFVYRPSEFCTFVDANAAGYDRTQIAPGVVLARRGHVYVAYIDFGRGGDLRVPTPEPQGRCNNGAVSVRGRTPGHFGGTVAINGNWFGCYLPDYFAGFSASDGVFRGTTGDHREGYVGQSAAGDLLYGRYAPIGFAQPAGGHHLVSGKTVVIDGGRWPDTTTASNDPTFTQRNPRSAAGINEDYLILAVVDGRDGRPGMTGTELADLMLDLGSVQAMSLDGGGSSALFVQGRGVVNDPPGAGIRAVGNQLVFDAHDSWLD